MTGSGTKIFFILSGSPWKWKSGKRSRLRTRRTFWKYFVLRTVNARSKQDPPLSVGFRTSATNKTPLVDGKVFIGKDVDQAGISITVGDTTGKLGAGTSSEQGFRVRRGRFAEPGAVTNLIGLRFSIRLKQRTDGRFGGAEIQIPLTRASKI
jgi:hypothetical protein